MKKLGNGELAQRVRLAQGARLMRFASVAVRASVAARSRGRHRSSLHCWYAAGTAGADGASGTACDATAGVRRGHGPHLSQVLLAKMALQTQLALMGSGWRPDGCPRQGRSSGAAGVAAAREAAQLRFAPDNQSVLYCVCVAGGGYGAGARVE